MIPTIISAVNNEEILENCLLKSPDLRSGVDVIVQRGFASAAAAYNNGMAGARTDLLVFVHQDVYLPKGWIVDVQRAIETLSQQDPNWGVLGVWGATNNGGRAGYLYWTGVEGTAGRQFEGGIEVSTLDEVLLIVRGSSGLSFDDSLRGFHMYGADICLEARQRGMKNYAIGAFCIHNCNEYSMLPLEFWKAYFFIRGKWGSQLPVKTPCIEITKWCWPMIKWNLIRSARLALGRENTNSRIPDPSLVYNSLVQQGLVAPR